MNQSIFKIGRSQRVLMSEMLLKAISLHANSRLMILECLDLHLCLHTSLNILLTTSSSHNSTTNGSAAARDETHASICETKLVDENSIARLFGFQMLAPVHVVGTSASHSARWQQQLRTAFSQKAGYKRLGEEDCR